MLSLYVSVGLLLIGALAIVFAVKPAVRVCRIDRRWGWKAMVCFIAAFLLGYSAYIGILLSGGAFAATELLLASIMCAGGVFVAMVCRLSLSTILRVREMTEQKYHNARHDALTGLANRKQLFERMDDYLLSPQHDDESAVILIDIDEFKAINDSLGHNAGDVLIEKVGRRLARHITQKDLIVRLGGDEFAIFMPHATLEDAEVKVKNLLHCMNEPLHVDQREIRVSLSFGISLSPRHGHQRSDLIKRAELAMYAAKKQRSGYSVYHESAEVNSLRRLKLTQALRGAVANRQFMLYFQPIVHAQDFSFDSFEVLLRWKDADNQFVSPEEFIPLAEEHGLINDITLWVVRESCEIAKHWREQGLKARLHLNLSARDLEWELLPEKVAEIFEQTDTSAGDVEFEITETAMMDDMDKVLSVIKQLNGAGSLMGIDDFGTGYGSLNLFRDLPVSQVKVDKSFVMQMREHDFSGRIVRSTINLAHTMDCSVVAEGVEDEATALLLHKMGCDLLQGYFIARPMPVSEVPDWLRSHQQRCDQSQQPAAQESGGTTVTPLLKRAGSGRS